MLTYKRPAGSRTEAEFITRYIDSVPGMSADEYGNRMVRVGESTTMFSAHTDTVHRRGGKQRIVVDETGGYIYRDKAKDCLGADDTTGIFIMLSMIDAGVPGLYIFHREEEIGGLGSAYIAESTPWVVDSIDRAIAFDRKGSHSVITHQFGERCASDQFASTLAGCLGGDYTPDSTGVFTDTANYTDLIPECTNLSVGYDSEHTPAESQDLMTLDYLLPRCIALPWDELPTERDPLDAVGMWNTGREDGSIIDRDSVLRHGIDEWETAYDLARCSPSLAADLLMVAYGKTRK